MGNAGPAIILVLSIAAVGFIGSLWAGYVSDAYLNIVQETAAGLDDVHWPDIAVFDWFARLLHLGWLVVFWLVPSSFLAMAIAPAWLRAEGGFASLLFLVVWLLVPVSLLSSMSAPSRWFVLYWPFLRRLAKHPFHFLGFLISTAAVLGIGVVSCQYALWHASVTFIFIGALALCASAILHARLVGRMAYQVAYHTPEKNKKSQKKERLPRATEVEDPWAVPPEAEEQVLEIAPQILESHEPISAALDDEEDEFSPNKKPYGVLEDNPASWQKAATPSYVEPSEPYEALPPEEKAAFVMPMDGYKPVGADAETAERAVEVTKTEKARQPSPFEQRLARRRQLPPRPKMLFVSGVYSFLIYEGTLRAWLYMSLGAWMLIGLARLIRSVWIV